MNPIIDFERELVLVFRGELRKVNELLPEAERSNGTACRVAAAAMSQKFMPQSELGRKLWAQHRSRTQTDTFYSATGLGTDVRKGTVERVSVLRILNEGASHEPS